MEKKKKECPYCKYEVEESLFEKHKEFCDKNVKGKHYRRKSKFFDKFFLSPIASLILIISIILAVTLKGSLWYLLAGLSLMWILFKKVDYDAGVGLKKKIMKWKIKK